MSCPRFRRAEGSSSSSNSYASQSGEETATITIYQRSDDVREVKTTEQKRPGERDRLGRRLARVRCGDPRPAEAEGMAAIDADVLVVPAPRCHVANEVSQHHAHHRMPDRGEARSVLEKRMAAPAAVFNAAFTLGHA